MIIVRRMADEVVFLFLCLFFFRAMLIYLQTQVTIIQSRLQVGRTLPCWSHVTIDGMNLSGFSRKRQMDFCATLPKKYDNFRDQDCVKTSPKKSFFRSCATSFSISERSISNNYEWKKSKQTSTIKSILRFLKRLLRVRCEWLWHLIQQKSDDELWCVNFKTTRIVFRPQLRQTLRNAIASMLVEVSSNDLFREENTFYCFMSLVEALVKTILGESCWCW